MYSQSELRRNAPFGKTLVAVRETLAALRNRMILRLLGDLGRGSAANLRLGESGADRIPDEFGRACAIEAFHQA